tara:strand:+ start:819 stop:2741 length:1923 start_codon:yes stop_codon:yes gene_type:complete
MCGIAGFSGTVKDPSISLSAMIKTISHRGPDDRGLWFDDNTQIGLAHSRLSILDLSSAGHQPMHSKSGRYVIVFNGEIYNYKQILRELEVVSTIKMEGHSDTEVLLASIEKWGLEKTLRKTSGMFALALWDREKNILSLARDRVGEKPLYYGWVNNVFVFASELKAFKQVGDFNNEIDRSALALLLRYSAIPAPFSIYKDINKLLPGYILEFNLKSKKLKNYKFWSLEEVYKMGKKLKNFNSDKDAISELDNILSTAVAQQMNADVPLGAFLSGGIDSSLIVSLMQKQSQQRVNTFSIGFDVKGFNEAEHARAVANHLSTDHFDMYVTEQDALDVIPDLPHIYDEPFADSSQIPTYLVSKIAKQKVTVALSGDAGDELFGGYNRYIFTKSMFEKIKKTPSPIKYLARKLIYSLSEENWNKYFGNLFEKRFSNFGYKLHKGANVLNSTSIRELHFKLASLIQNPTDWLIDASEHLTILNDGIDRYVGFSQIEQMMIYDLLTYLPTDILTKVDRAAMAVSLETRVPFLDPSVIEFSAQLPLNYKIRNGESKWILRELLYKHVPKDLIQRPKMGFAVPLAEWLRGPLRDWAEMLLDERRLQNEGFFNVKVVRDKWNEHISGKRNWHYQLWNVLIFQTWLENNS